MAWHAMVGIRHGMVWYGMVIMACVWHGMGMAWHGRGMVWHGMVGVCYGMVVVWYDIAW